jgi:hypothetical protein
VTLFGKLGAAASDPVFAGYFAWSRLHADSLVASYRARARAAGLDRLYLVLSFDCDTPDDRAVAWDVHCRLAGIGISPCYAVPGELLAEGADVYRRIAAGGAEFVNHGGRRHTYFDAAAGAHRSSFFYDQQPLEMIEADVVAGDRMVTDIVGVRPRGFRTPHFGTFQTPAQLRFLHGVLRRLGYAFSTSTAPYFGFRYGPAFDRFGIRELPVSGHGSRPLQILDSWGCFAAPDRVLAPADYRREATAMAARLAGGPGVLNYYADPSHVADQPIFFDTMAALLTVATPISFSARLEKLR